MNSNDLPLHRPLFGKHAHAGVPDDDWHADLHVGHGDAAGCVRVAAIDDDAAIHFLIGHRNPMSAQPNLGPLVRGAVKALGKRAVDVGRDQLAVVLRRRHGAVIGDLRRESSASASLVSAPDFDQRIARIVAGLADRDLS